jgi:hypothetical protein
VRAIWLTLLAAWCLGGGLAVAADKKPDEKKAPDKKVDASKPGAAKEVPVVITNTPPIQVAFPKATFNLALEVGRDPFYPSSKRRVPKAPKPPPVTPGVPKPPVTPPEVVVVPPATNLPPVSVVTNTVPVVPPPPPPDVIGSANLALRGLSGPRDRRVAVVHTGARSYDFRKGDSTLIRLPSEKTLKVRCVDIRERSAIFQAEGETETKELFLREGL